MNAWPLPYLPKHSMGNPQRCPWQRLSRGPQKVVTGVVATKDRGRVWHDLLISSANATPILRFYYNKMHKLQERVAKLQEQVGSPSRGAPLLSSNCSLLFVSSLAFICAHIYGRLRSNMSTKRWWSETWLVSTCWNKARQTTNWFMEQIDAILSLQRVAVSSFSVIQNHPLYWIWWCMSVPWCFEISLVFSIWPGCPYLNSLA